MELQVPESLEKAVVKLPVELAQDDSWRMESVMSKYENQILIFPDYLEEFPDTDELVWILGKQHPLKTGKPGGTGGEDPANMDA